jgi:hypothetical protein
MKLKMYRNNLNFAKHTRASQKEWGSGGIPLEAAGKEAHHQTTLS